MASVFHKLGTGHGQCAGLLLSLLCAALVLCGCTGPREWLANGLKVGPEYRTPCVPIAPDWIDADDRRVLHDPVDHVAWWTVFEDPMLNQLVSRAYRQNLSVRQAGARIMEARALRDLSAGNMFPQQQDVSASYSHNLATGTGPNRHFSTWRSSFDLSWELDFWGRFRRAMEAADADLEASVYDYGDVVVTLVADVAATYIDIRTLQTRLVLVKQNVDNQRNTYELTETRFQGGELSEIDVQQAKSSLAQTEAFVPQLETALRQSQNQLCILLGIPPEDINAWLGEAEIPSVPSEIALGLPAELLVRRPDVRRAERRLAAQSALIGVAESNWYPQLTLSGTSGVTAGNFDDLFRTGASFGSIGPSLRWNILNYGRILANVEIQDARFLELLQLYRETVLVANAEAENAIVEFLNSQRRLEWQLEAAEAADRTNELINLQLEEGEADINRVFNVQNFKTQQEESAAVAKGAVAQNLIEIYRSLGGGWPSPFLCEPIIGIPQVEEVPEAAPQEDLPAPDVPLGFPGTISPLNTVENPIL